MLNSSGESGHLCLVPGFRGNAFNFSPWRITFAVDLSYIAFTVLSYVPSIPAFWKVFIINGCWILSKAFSASIEMLLWFLFFNLLMWFITLIDLQILKNPCIPGIKTTWLWCMIFLMHCWILIARILLRFFCPYVHQWYWPVVFFFLWHLCQVLVLGDGGLIEWVWKFTFLCNFLLKFE